MKTWSFFVFTIISGTFIYYSMRYGAQSLSVIDYKWLLAAFLSSVSISLIIYFFVLKRHRVKK
jgi:hypothetical protein